MPRVLNLANVQQFAAINSLSDPGYLPGPKVIPGACMVRLDWNLTDAKVGHNVLYASWNGTPALTTTIAQAIFAAITTGGIWTPMAAHLATTAQLRAVTLLDVRSTTGTYFTSTGAGVPGTSTGTALPDEVAICVSLLTANRGPAGRGRFYIPGWASTAAAAGGIIAAATVTAINNWVSGLLSPTVTSQLGPLVLGLPARAAYTSPITGRVFPARAATTVPLTGLAVRGNSWDSQRRRGLK